MQRSHDHCWRHFAVSAKNVWQTRLTWQTRHARKNQPFFARGKLSCRLTAPLDIDFPPRGGILVRYLRCETGQQPYGRRRIIRFRCRGPADSLSHAEMSFASGFLPSTTTDFLAPRGNCVHHADRDFQHLIGPAFNQQGRDRKSVSPDRFSYSQHVTNCPVVRLATSARAAAALSHSRRTACVGATFAPRERNE